MSVMRISHRIQRSASHGNRRLRKPHPASEVSILMLDPKNWDAFRTLAHQMLDDALDGIKDIREHPVWVPMPQAAKDAIRDDANLQTGQDINEVYARYRELIEPYTTGNRHPRFFGWVHGNGTPSGMLAQMLMAGLNSNAGGREHSAPYVERAVIAWWAKIFGFPAESSGIVTTGTSMATLLAVLTARTQALGAEVRTTGLAGHRLTGYTATSVHHSTTKAFEISGIGSDALRRVAVDADGRIDIEALKHAIADDRAAGYQPFLLVGTAGTVDRGASDDLSALADVAAEENLWFHVDGAFGAMAILAPERKHLVAGIERADSVAMDFHKWMHVPYGAGLMLTRHEVLHRATFADNVPYLARLDQGTAGGQPWFCDYGPELSRGFIALGVWMAMQEFGLERIGAAIEHDCRMATQLAQLLIDIPGMRIMAPVHLNIVCARFERPGMTPEQLDDFNGALVVALQCSGVAVPSTTRIAGRLVMRFNFTNHRVREDDLRVLVAAVNSIITEQPEGAGCFSA
jgi:aromatic-L-amino-acid decarboxylase